MKITSTGKFLLCAPFLSRAFLTNDDLYRLGRTGRAGNRGTAYTLISPSEAQFASELIRALELSHQESKIGATLRQLASSHTPSCALPDTFSPTTSLPLRHTQEALGASREGRSGYRTKGVKFVASELSKQQEMRMLEEQAYLYMIK